jgi:hypothetical protein
MQYLYKPAFYAHLLSSIALVAALIILIMNYKQILKLNAAIMIQVLGVLAIAIAAHGQGHATLERDYGYDPLSVIRN